MKIDGNYFTKVKWLSLVEIAKWMAVSVLIGKGLNIELKIKTKYFWKIAEENWV